MTLIDLIKEYPNVSPDILKFYKEADKFIIFNDNDKDLYPIKVKLPSPPSPHKIANFGKHPRDQKWKAPVMPPKLITLVKKEKTIDRIWAELDKNQFYYKEEIKFIKKQWYYVLNGYWIYINGIPTYIDGWHYMYIAWWNIDVGLPKYRSRDRKFFIFLRWCYTTTEAIYFFRIYYKKQYLYYPTKEEALEQAKDLNIDYHDIEGGVFVRDMGKRTVIGMNYPKYRREGATHKAEVPNYVLCMTHFNVMGGIQSMTDGDAKKVYQKAVIKPWKKLPFFFKPIYEGSTNPKEELSFTPQAIRISIEGSPASVDSGLESKIDFAIADGSGYDGQKLIYHHHDEVGKFKSPLDIRDISSTVRECLTLDMGQTIVGLGIKTSTVGKMDDGQGGDLFRDYCDMSMSEYRNQNGMTITGYVNMFIPAEDGIVIDEFGNSVIEDPKTELKSENGLPIKFGGRTIINNERQSLLAKGKYEDLAKHKRQFPNCFSECFSTVGGNSNLPIGLVESRLGQILFNNPTKRRGNLYWSGIINGKSTNDKGDPNPLFGSDVHFQEDPLGKWYISGFPKQNEMNARFYDKTKQSWVPKFKYKRTLGIDPFKHNITKDTRRSEGGGAVFYKHDITVDPDPDYNNWKHSSVFTCTYSNRTFDKYIFFEDMLMTAIFNSCGMFPENNLSEIYEWIIRMGYEEYLIFKWDFMTGKEELTPGQAMANNRAKEDMFTEYSTHLNRHCLREVHDELLMQVKKIGGPKETTKYDLFTAGGWALIGSRYILDDPRKFEDHKVTLSDYIPVYDFSN
jgi:hypothetical protein